MWTIEVRDRGERAWRTLRTFEASSAERDAFAAFEEIAHAVEDGLSAFASVRVCRDGAVEESYERPRASRPSTPLFVALRGGRRQTHS